MDLFEYMRSTNMEKEAPLAARMRPRTLDEVVGQEHIIGKDKLLYRAIKADKISSIISMDRPVPAKRRWRKSLPILPVLNFNRLMPQWRAKGYGRSGGKGEGTAGNVQEAYNSVH